MKASLKVGSVRIVNMCSEGHLITIERDLVGTSEGTKVALQNAFNAASDCSTCREAENDRILKTMHFR